MSLVLVYIQAHHNNFFDVSIQSLRVFLYITFTCKLILRLFKFGLLRMCVSSPIDHSFDSEKIVEELNDIFTIYSSITKYLLFNISN